MGCCWCWNNLNAEAVGGVVEDTGVVVAKVENSAKKFPGPVACIFIVPGEMENEGGDEEADAPPSWARLNRDES